MESSPNVKITFLSKYTNNKQSIKGKSCKNAALISYNERYFGNEGYSKGNNCDNNSVKSISKCTRTSSGNCSFTAGSSKREISRISTFNRSFNNATNLASSFRQKLCSRLAENTTNKENNNLRNNQFNQSLVASSSNAKSSTSMNNLQTSVNNVHERCMKDFSTTTKQELLTTGLMRKFSQRVKNQVQSSFSDPLKTRESTAKLSGCGETCGICARCQQAQKNNQLQSASFIVSSGKPTAIQSVIDASPLGMTLSVRKKMVNLSNRFQLPKLMTDNDDKISVQNDDGEFVAESSSDESNDPEFLELREREEIVEKYEKGPDSKDVDPWENPDFELYKVTDRFGFVHKSEAQLLEEKNERQRIERELKREHKWLRMLDEWKQRHPAKLPERIWKGIPEKLRLVFWKKLLGVDDMKNNARANLYNELLMRARLISKDVKQIDLDINRTYRDHLAFRRRYDVKQQSLFNVLAAYAMFNTEVGYCQGMSQIAAIFLMYMDEEDAFWCLHSLLANRKYSMHGFFVPGFPKLMRFQNHYEKVIQKYLPKLKKHQDKAGIPNIHLTKWWFGCFLDRVPFSLAIRVWDVFLYYGDCILIAMAYNIIKMHRKTFLKLQLEGFMEFVQQKLAANFGFPNDQVMESLQDCLKRLQSDRMALPPPPNPDDPSEIPIKPLGPILTRSMIDIRMDIAEIHSRCSRANSLAGRSPAIKRHSTKQGLNVVPQKVSQLVNDNALPGSSNFEKISTNKHLKSIINENIIDGSQPVNSSTVSSETFGRIPLEMNRGRRPLKPPPVPDSDGFVPMSPRQHKQRVASYYDNVPFGTNSTAQATFQSISNRNSLKNKNNERRFSNTSSTVNNVPPNLPLKNNHETIVEQTFANVNISNDEKQIHQNSNHRESSIKKNLTESVKHKSNNMSTSQQRQPLSQVVELYQQQQQQQQAQKFLPLENNVVSFPSDKPSPLILTADKEKEQCLTSLRYQTDFAENSERNVLWTQNNVTYISVNNEQDLIDDVYKYHSQQCKPLEEVNRTNLPKRSQLSDTTTKLHHTAVVPLPYCPPPDYNNDDKKNSKKICSDSNLTNKHFNMQAAQLQKVRNTENYCKVNQLHPGQASMAWSHNNSNDSYNSQQNQKLRETYDHNKYLAPVANQLQQQVRRKFERQPVSATISQPVISHCSYYNNVPQVPGPKYYPGETFGDTRYDNNLVKSYISQHQEENWRRHNSSNNDRVNGPKPKTPFATQYYSSIVPEQEQIALHRGSLHQRSASSSTAANYYNQKQQQLPDTTIIRKF